MEYTEQQLIDIKDDYLGLVSDTYDEITPNHEKSGHTIAPQSTISRRADLEGAGLHPEI
jgi:hypothetical protein